MLSHPRRDCRALHFSESTLPIRRRRLASSPPPKTGLPCDWSHRPPSPSKPPCPAVLQPVVVRAVQLHHLAKTFPAFTPGSVLLPRAPNTPDALFHQPAPQGFMIHYQAFLVHLFGRQRGTEIRITLLVAGQHLALQSRALRRGPGLPRLRCTSPESPAC